MRIRLEYKTILDGRYHVFTSPDLKGLYVTGETLEDAEREAYAMIALIRKQRGSSAVPTAIEFAEELAA